MDSESYLLKIIRSGSKSTADSLYLQTTIGKGIRWPIALLISTVITVLAVVLCLVWRHIRRPLSVTTHQDTRFDQYIDDPQVIVSSSSPPQKSRIKKLGPNQLLTSSVFLENSPKTPKYNPRLSKSDQDLAWDKDDLFFPKRKVSLAPSNCVKHVRGVTKKKRRHSKMTPCLSPIDFPEGHWSFSVSSLSTVSNTSSNSNDVAVESDAAIIKVNKPSQLHLQISKTIAVLDDLNKSLQENHGNNSDSPPPLREPVASTPVPIPLDKNKRKRHHYKFFKPLVKNSENTHYVRSPSSLDAKTFDELEHLLDEPF